MEYTDTIRYRVAEEIMASGYIAMHRWGRNRHRRRYQWSSKLYFFGDRMAVKARDRFIRKQLGA